MARAKGEASPMEQLEALARTLAGTPIPRAFLVRGEERWFRDQALELLLANARKASFELARHDPQDPDFSLRALCDDLAAAPMFASARCVLVRNGAALIKKEGGDDAPFVRAARSWLDDAAREGMLIVEAESLRADSVLAKAIASAGGTSLNLRRLWDSPPPWDSDPRRTELVQWLLARARAKSIALNADDALYVAAATGNDLHALDDALERLRHRGQKSVRAAVGWSASASPFQIAEDLCRGDAPRAVAGIEALFQAGLEGKDGVRDLQPEAVIAVLCGSLRSKLRQTLAGARVLAAGGDVGDAAEAAGVPGNPRARGEFEARVRARSAARWTELVRDLAALERRGRSGATLDANDLVALALRWRVVAQASRAPAPPPRAPSGGSFPRRG